MLTKKIKKGQQTPPLITKGFFSDSPAFCLLPADDISGVIYSDETAA